MALDEAELQRVSDELAIRSLVQRYSDAVMRRDAKDWGETWAEDGRWQVGMVAEGRDKIVEFWLSLMGRFKFVMQHPQHGVIDLQGDRASGRWSVNELGIQTDGTPGLTIGVYVDEYRRIEGEWKFAARRFEILYMGPPDLTGSLIPMPEDLV